jgi:putative endonuclease
MKALSVYMIRCSDGSYYIGVTNDVEKRMQEHHAGVHPTSYTLARRPLTLVYASLPFSEWADAITWEKTLKGWSRRKKEALMRGEYEKLPMIACMCGDWSIALIVRQCRFCVMVSLTNHTQKRLAPPCRPSSGSG